MFDYLIVGAGLTGCTLAERIANALNKRVLLVDKRSHIGGNAYDCYDENGILIHKYGPHIFHTNLKHVWDYLSQFTEWYLYQHKVLAYVNGQLVPMPINVDAINMLYNTSYTSQDIDKFYDSVREKIDDIKNSEDMVTSKVGKDLYEMFFKNYTKKQWDLYPEELEPEVTARIPIRKNRDDRYFSDKYQGLPLHGYTKMCEKMLSNNNISILLNTNYQDAMKEIKAENVIFTGKVDEYFDYKFGELPYRSLDFAFETVEQEYYQPIGVVNYPNDYDFTRITEFKYMTGQKHAKTTIVKEFSKSGGEPYYPIPQKKNQELYSKYKELTDKAKNVYFAGRLGRYKYINMDIAVHEALELFKTLK